MDITLHGKQLRWCEVAGSKGVGDGGEKDGEIKDGNGMGSERAARDSQNFGFDVLPCCCQLCLVASKRILVMPECLMRR